MGRGELTDSFLCSLVAAEDTVMSVDVMDISGEHLEDVKHDLKRHRLDHEGGEVHEAMGGE